MFDYDTFSADDIMGEAEIDIQPLITSAMAFGDPEMFGDMQIGKWLKSNDNALIEDSIINIADGKVKQEVQIKLQNEESGELELNGCHLTNNNTNNAVDSILYMNTCTLCNTLLCSFVGTFLDL